MVVSYSRNETEFGWDQVGASIRGMSVLVRKGTGDYNFNSNVLNHLVDK